MAAFWIVFLAAFLLALLFSPVSGWLAPKIGAVDVPKDERRMHTKPMPRFGGMAICIGALCALALATWVALPMYEAYFRESFPGAVWEQQPVAKMQGILAGGILIYILGIIDDLRGMLAKVKLLGQIAVACVAFASGIRIEFITNHFMNIGDLPHIFFAGSAFSEILCFLITVVWIVAITNTVNLIDGLDGLAAGVAAIASLCLAYTAYIHGGYMSAMALLALAGAAIGFLPANFHPARIFMGDGGSLFLGYMLATLSIVGPVKGATVFAMIAPVLVLGLPIFDTSFAILRRLINHRPIMEADKGHLHHRLMASGMGQRRTVLTLYGISGIMGVAAVLFSRDLFVETVGLVAITAMYIYIFLTDANTWKLKIKAVNIAHEEKKQAKMQQKQFFEPPAPEKEELPEEPAAEVDAEPEEEHAEADAEPERTEEGIKTEEEEEKE